MSDDLKPFEIQVTVKDATSERTIHGEITSEATTPQQITESVEHVLKGHYGEKRWRAVETSR